ncbi:type II toxin-antitoxin system Phd/YefM family antitoxin [Marinimicrococcus flavescens]|uniref:Antitoxin n=1 Tax=Marinimicrococcus flavescens TaxID=3031815 RepID=A0AAP3XPN6_9PROT|nr:type II toxin-antitoxin system prevent-host-death family antitoxin [Marinimicrococcus flavescens]
MLTISARDANQQFSRILDAAARGEEVVITRRGVPVARLVPAAADDKAAAERQERQREALDFFRKGGLSGGVLADWTREELYEERLAGLDK